MRLYSSSIIWSLSLISFLWFFGFTGCRRFFRKFLKNVKTLESGAKIGDGDHKSWDPSGPLIWNNFSIFRTNCAILTSSISANPRTCRGFSRVCCHVAWSKMVRVASFRSEDREIRQGRRIRALLCTFMLWANGKGKFFRVENFFNFAIMIWMNNICSRFLYA